MDIFSADSPITTNERDEKENAKKTSSNKVLLAIRYTFSNKKKNKTQALASRLIAKGSSFKVPRQNGLQTPLSNKMELIWPCTQKIRVPSNAVESISLKKMRKI